MWDWKILDLHYGQTIGYLGKSVCVPLGCSWEFRSQVAIKEDSLLQGIMRGISTRSNLQKGNWAASLSEKLKLYWRVGRLPGVPPFKPQRRWEAVDYARLPLEDRQG